MANNKKLLKFLEKFHASIGGPGLPNYAPQHDLKNLGVIVTEELYEDLFAEEPCRLKEAWIKEFPVSEEELREGWKAFLKMSRCMIGESREETVAEAARTSGYDQVPMKVKGLIDSLFGRAMMAAFWYAVRDVTDSQTKQMPAWINYHTLENMFQEAVNSLDGDESRKGERLIKVRDEQ